MDSLTRNFSLFLLSLFMTFPVAAQEQPAQPAEQTQTASPSMSDEEVTIMRDDFAGKYNISTLENLSKLYWRLGAFDFEDDAAISNFIKINDCKIYAEYINDDLEWKEILRAMKDHLRKHYNSYPLNYQFVLELHLGRYDSERRAFPLVDKTGFKDAKRIGVDSIDHTQDVCYDSSPIKDYPKSMVVILDKPFTLDEIKLDEHVAQAYILRKKSEFSALNEEQRIKSYERPAYLRLRITFSQYHGNMKGDDSQITALVYGKIEGYEIFEDSDQKRIMVSVDMSDQAASKEETPVNAETQPGTMTMPQPQSGVTSP